MAAFKAQLPYRHVDGYLGSYAIPEAARALQSFVDDMSNWYVRRGRERFWAQGMEQDEDKRLQ